MIINYLFPNHIVEILPNLIRRVKDLKNFVVEWELVAWLKCGKQLNSSRYERINVSNVTGGALKINIAQFLDLTYWLFLFRIISRSHNLEYLCIWE